MTRRMPLGGVVAIAAIVLASCTSSSTSQDAPVTEDASSTTQVTTADAHVGATAPQVGDETVCSDEFNETAQVMLDADLDGDGDSEFVAVDRQPNGTTILRVCGIEPAPAPYDVGDTTTPAEVSVLDVDGDGTAELIVGGPTGAGPFSGSVVRLEDGELVDLQLALTVTSTENTGTSFACIDADGDGDLELVTQTYTFDADTRDEATEVAWTRTVVFDDGVVDGPTTSGTFDVAEQPDEVDALIEPTCAGGGLFVG